MVNLTAERKGWTLVVWQGTSGPVPLQEGRTGVEFRGRLGHPSSFGLVAGRSASPSHPSSIVVDELVSGEPLKVPIDDVRLGLPAEYRQAILGAFERSPYRVDLTDAAHGKVGSSPVIFFALTVSLIQVLQRGPEFVTEQQLWAWWDDARDAARTALGHSAPR
jgi:hypothetical protein